MLLTTDTSMNFVKAFELYERRWGIEVIFKECRGYLGLGNVRVGATMLGLGSISLLIARGTNLTNRQTNVKNKR